MGLENVFDLENLRILFEEFSEATGYTIGFVDEKTKEVLLSVGWSDICKNFHRATSESEKLCKESNAVLTEGLNKLKELNISHCKHHMVDGATPIIINGKHIANVFTGQVQFQEPNIEEFKKDAKKFGYDEEKYLEALKKVRVVNEDDFRKTLKFLGSLAKIISELAMLNNQLKKEHKKEIKLRKKLEELNNSLEQKVLERTKELERMASIDELTNIYNRRKFFKVGHEIYNNETTLSVVMVDLNKFKNINDIYGHQAGDKILKYVASTINELLPKDTLFGRIGGDEFAILLKSNKKDSEKIMQNIKKQISIRNIKHNEKIIKTSISYGISTKSNLHESLDYLLQKADEKLYDMKREVRKEFRN